MYPKNADSPRPIKAKVVRASTGAAITTGVACFHSTGTTRMAATNSPTHLSSGQWTYLPTKAETNYDEFSIEFYHADAVAGGPVVQVVTSELEEMLDATGFDRDDLLEEIEDVLIDSAFDQNDVATATRVELGMAASDLDTQLAALLAAIGTGGGGGWTDALTESYPAVGAEPTPAQLLYMILALVLQPDLDGTTMSARGLAGTVVMTFRVTLNSSNYPVKMIRLT